MNGYDLQGFCNGCYYRDTSAQSYLRQQPNDVTEKTKIITYDKPNIDAYLRIPVYQSNQHEAAINTINREIENDIMEFSRQMEEAANEYAELAKQKGEKFIPYIISTIYETTYNKNNLLSTSILYNEFVGGRNSFIKTSYNYDLNTGKSLGIGDLFKPGADYKQIINKEIRTELSQNSSKYFPGALEQFKGIAEDQPFYIGDDGIYVYFGFHEIAPKESQIPIIKIPFSHLQTVLKPQLLRALL